MALSNHYTNQHFGLSFEVFPPKTPKGMDALWLHVDELMAFGPAFMTCTYGAGGSTRDKTLDITAHIYDTHDIPVAAHLTCVGSTRDQLRAFLAEAAKRGIAYIVALRGDPPEGDTEFRPVDGGLAHANELVDLIRAEFPQFGIAVAGYPEVHQEAPSAEVDLENLKRKVDAGADIVMTQLFYSNDDFYTFQERCESIGIQVPIIPGILPVTSGAQLQRVVKNCGSHMPADLFERFTAHETDEDAQFDIGIQHAIQQTQALIDHGVKGLHFYVLNKSHTTSTILRELKLRSA